MSFNTIGYCSLAFLLLSCGPGRFSSSPKNQVTFEPSNKRRFVIEEDSNGKIPTGTNLLINGSFEYPKLAGGWSLHSDSEYDPKLFGWEVAFLNSKPCSVDSPKNTKGLLEIQRFDKNYQWAELDSHCRVGSVLDTRIVIHQEVILEKGSYSLSFRYVHRAGDNSARGLHVLFGGQTLNLSNNKEWLTYTAKVTVNKENEKIVLHVREKGEGNSLGSLVDDFKIIKFKDN